MGVLRNVIVFVVGAFAGGRLLRRKRPTAPPQAKARIVRHVAPGGAVPEQYAEGSGDAGRARMRRWVIRTAIGLPALALLGFLVAASGVIPITASSGHWAVTRWFLEFSKSRSVATHSLGIDVPRLDDDAMVLKGAAHFETGCRPCHGSPGLRAPRIGLAMTPPPPELSRTVEKWDPEELFYIVKHGIKFTGMPAWPSLERDDEVWAMVAFLLRLPGLDGVSYRALVEGEASTERRSPAVGEGSEVPPIAGLVAPSNVPETVASTCGRCHGIDGNGRGTGAFPRLAGQRPNYLVAALEAYANGRRHSGIMRPIAAALNVEEMREIARYYAGLSEPGTSRTDFDDSGLYSPEPDSAVAASIQRGRRIAMDGVPEEGIPSCRDCHGPEPTRRNPFYPNLAGQYADYIRLQLELLQQDRRGGSRFVHLMHPTAERLSAEQVRDVAAYYEGIGDGK